MLAVSVAVFVLLERVASHLVRAGSLDAWGHRLAVAHRSDVLVSVAKVVTDGGTVLVSLSLVLIGVALLSPRRGWYRIVPAAWSVAVFGLGWLTRLAVSDALARPRPPAQDWAVTTSGYAFPSGHTTAASLAAGLLVWAAVRRFSGRRRILVASWVVGGVFAAAVGLTRVYLGVHWPTDVLGAWAFSAAWLSAAVVVRRLAAARGRSTSE